MNGSLSTPTQESTRLDHRHAQAHPATPTSVLVALFAWIVVKSLLLRLGK